VYTLTFTKKITILPKLVSNSLYLSTPQTINTVFITKRIFMKYLTMVASGMILISSYLCTTEYPRQGKLSHQSAFGKYGRTPQLSFIILHNQLKYDINVYDIVSGNIIINPAESTRIQLKSIDNNQLPVFVHALESELTLEFKKPFPHNIYFRKEFDSKTKTNCIMIAYDEQCVGKYVCKKIS
jgi:hypothetical protein